MILVAPVRGLGSLARASPPNGLEINDPTKI
jgi:hypothetical protein